VLRFGTKIFNCCIFVFQVNQWVSDTLSVSVCAYVCCCVGKVHGSLTRAGKVKKATPKVEPMDKPKKPRGRAYKRLQYNRRFVNVVVGQKKKGPNQARGEN
jgi:small subunit ribosomal protein S30e